MSNQRNNNNNNNKRKLKKTHEGKLKPGDLVPMPEEQINFLRLRKKYVSNQEVEHLMLLDNSPNGHRMVFGNNPLPWEVPMIAQDFEHLKQAQDRTYTCQNKECKACGQEAKAKYYIVIHKHEIPHFNFCNPEIDRVQNKNQVIFFGKRENLCIHVGVRCKICDKHIKYVKRSLANRRAAKDPFVSGPHQHYGMKPTYQKE